MLREGRKGGASLYPQEVAPQKRSPLCDLGGRRPTQPSERVSDTRGERGEKRDGFHGKEGGRKGQTGNYSIWITFLWIRNVVNDWLKGSIYQFI